MDNLVHIGNADISIKEYKGERVVTFKDIDMVHERPDGTARKIFSDNRKHFVEGKDYFVLKPSDLENTGLSEKQTLENIVLKNFGIALITERGYLMLVKSFTDDLAWKVQRKLVSSYFNVYFRMRLEHCSRVRYQTLRMKGSDCMNELQIFNNEEFGEVRTAVVNDEPMFCLADVCKALEIKNATDVAKRLDDDERTRLNLGRQGETNFITESGLYAVILRSDKPNAKKFRKWVTSEILPSIRKTGGYEIPKSTSGQIQLLAQGYTELEEAVNSIKEDVTELKDNVPLYGCEIDEVSKHVKRKAVNVLGGKDSEAYRDASIRSQLFTDIYSQIKREYGLVSSYKSIKRKYIADVHDFIDCYEPPMVLGEQIKDANNQISMTEI